MTRLASPAVVALVLAVVSASPAAAQPTDQPETETRQRPESYFDVTVDLFGAVDRAFGSVDETQSNSGDRTYWGGNSTLSYEKTSGRFSLAAEGGASARRLTDVTDGLLPSYSGAMRVTGPLSRRSSWELQQSFSYGPTNAVVFFAPGDPIEGVQSTVPLVDYRLNDENQLSSQTRGGLNYAVSRRGSLSLILGYEHAGQPRGLDEDADTGAFRRWDIGGRYSNRLSRYMSWYAGYGLQQNMHGDDAGELRSTPRLHSIDSGIAYNRPLSFSRRTRVSAQVGSSLIQDEQTNDRQWRANVIASLRHELGRTWFAHLAYQRDTQYLPTFAEPVLNDAVTVKLNGSLSSRASVDAMANYSRGSVGIAEGSNGYTLLSTSTSFRYAFVRQLAAYVEYFLFDSDFEQDVMLADARIRSSQRHGVRFGISIGTGLWGSRRGVLAAPVGESER